MQIPTAFSYMLVVPRLFLLFFPDLFFFFWSCFLFSSVLVGEDSCLKFYFFYNICLVDVASVSDD